MVNDYSSEIDIPEKQVCDASGETARPALPHLTRIQASSCALADSESAAT